MGRTQVAVGCAVGIPIGVGIIIAAIFWLRLQRRFKKEMEDDKELEHAIYDESGFISFDNFDSLKQDQVHETQNDLSRASDNTTITTTNDENAITHPRRNHNSNVYIPAYRKKINSMHVRNTRMNSYNNVSETNSSEFGNPQNIHNSSMTSLSELPPQHTYKQTSSSQIMSNIYDQMVPMVESLNNETYFSKPKDIVSSSNNSNMVSSATLQSQEITNNNHNSNSILLNQSNNDQLKNLYHNSDLDLGSYYPRHPSNAGVNDSSSTQGYNNDFINSYGSPSVGSHMFSSGRSNNDSPRKRNLQNQNNNIFATPTTEKSGFDFSSTNDTNSIEPRNLTSKHLHNRSKSQNNVDLNSIVNGGTTTGNLQYNDDQHSSDSDIESTTRNNYNLQNNYDVRNNNEIQEEDQYENEFTNYTENRRQFLDSLRPH
ncbi:suppressor of lethality of KEX2 GAS1 double null mutant protein 1 [Maudiozyma exigua]|uniref:Suppressor of lethality of KEX2 GAS1 double null mutant protein 1 n=1 Tax=Maudiozyma exigua TaxID=34358 RepID=A0A9P6WCR1_MAUEX|nr:suppressor of lethality of KEX2 GAS1 double null mutant protein 1 [Kazachstania exigua]